MVDHEQTQQVRMHRPDLAPLQGMILDLFVFVEGLGAVATYAAQLKNRTKWVEDNCKLFLWFRGRRLEPIIMS